MPPRPRRYRRACPWAHWKRAAAAGWSCALRWLPSWVVRHGWVPAFAAHTRRLVASAAGVALVVAPDAAPATDVQVGRAAQRAWLAATAAGLAVQPMMSLLVLENLLDHPGARWQMAADRDRLVQLRGELQLLVPEIGRGRPAFLFRFGFAPPPSGRTGRLPARLGTSVLANGYYAHAEQ